MVDSLSIPVLVVGGGPVGLAAALDLGQRGITSILVEERDARSRIPRVTTVNTIGMILCRRWGIVDRVRDVKWPNDYPLDIAFFTSLTGREITRFEIPSHAATPPPETVPEITQTCPQHWFDPIMLEAARATPNTDLRHHHRLESFSENDDGILASVSNLETGESFEISAQYLLACDGARSSVRAEMGIEMVGEDHDHNVHVMFRAPGLKSRLAPRNARFHYLMNDQGIEYILHMIDGHEEWRLAMMRFSEQPDPESIDFEAILMRVVGEPFEYEITGIDLWQRSTRSAERYGTNRVFLVGDAAHTWSPNGGFGMNTGLSDAANICWKIAASLEGWGGPALVQSYDAERRPVCEKVIGEARENYRRLGGLGDLTHIDADGPQGEETRDRLAAYLQANNRRNHATIGTELNYCYEESPVTVPDATLAPEGSHHTYVPTARPGHLAPHAWLIDGRSTHDLFRDGFTLLTFGPTGGDLAKMVGPADAAGMPLKIVAINDPDIAELYGAALVLVRPDGHVAWRGDALPKDGAAVIDCVRGA